MQAWKDLHTKSDERKAVLNESFHLQSFSLGISWFNDMGTWYGSTGTEALVERHSEFKSEIDAQKDSFANVQRIGNELIQQDHYTKNDIELKLQELIDQQHKLDLLWSQRLMFLQLFLRDIDQTLNWIQKQDQYLIQK